MIDGNRLKELRGDQSLLSVYRETGVSRSLISRLERGDRVGCRAETLYKLARYYGVTADYLMGGSDG